MQVNKKRIIINTILLYTKTVISLIVSLFTTRLVLAALGELDYGIYGTVGGAIAMLSVLNIAMTKATQRFMNYAEGGDNKDRLLYIFNNTIILHIGLGLIIVAFMAVLYYPFFHGIFNIPIERLTAAKYIYLFLAISTFFTIITVPYNALVNAHEDFLYYSIVGIITSFLNYFAALVISQNYMQDKLILYGMLMALIAIFNMLVMRLYCKKKYQECVFSPRKYANTRMAKEIGVFSGWNFVGALAQMTGNHGSNILMNHYFGAIMITPKNIGDQISTQVAVLANNMNKALAPSIVKSEGGGDRETMINLSYVSCRFGVFLFLILAIPFLFNTEPLLGAWLKSIPKWAVLFCQLQIIRCLFEQLFGPLGTMLMAQGSVKQMNVVDLVLGVITFVVIWLLYSLGFHAQWHYYVSIGILVIINGIIKLQLCKIICNLNPWAYVRVAILPCANVMIVAAIVVFLLQISLFKNLILFSVTLQVVAVIIVVLLIGLTKLERKAILGKMTGFIISRK